MLELAHSQLALLETLAGGFTCGFTERVSHILTLALVYAYVTDTCSKDIRVSTCGMQTFTRFYGNLVYCGLISDFSTSLWFLFNEDAFAILNLISVISARAYIQDFTECRTLRRFVMTRKVQQKAKTQARATIDTLLTGEQRNVCSTVTIWNPTDLFAKSPQWQIDTSHPSNQPLDFAMSLCTSQPSEVIQV